MNLILFHFIEKKFHLISLRLLSFSVSFHFMKKNLILFHLMKIKSDSVSSHQKKISSHSDSDLEQNQIRTENSDSCDQSSCIVVSLYIQNLSQCLKQYIIYCFKCLHYQTARHVSYRALQLIIELSILFHTV